MSIHISRYMIFELKNNFFVKKFMSYINSIFSFCYSINKDFIADIFPLGFVCSSCFSLAAFHQPSIYGQRKNIWGNCSFEKDTDGQRKRRGIIYSFIHLSFVLFA